MQNGLCVFRVPEWRVSMRNHPIGIFDSGLGGLTTVREIQRIMPGEDIIYFGDTGRVPYGNRSRETIIRYTKDDIDFLLKHDIKLIIAACGTASSVALPVLSDRYRKFLNRNTFPCSCCRCRCTS